MSYLDSKRIVGTNADRIGSDGISGGWKELGRTTLGSNNANINVSSIPDKRYYMILSDLDLTAVSTGGGARLGNSTVDTGSNYAMRYSVFGGSDTTSTSTDKFLITGGSSPDPELNVTYIANKSDKEKLIISHRGYGIPGASNPPKRFEFASKWVNTSNPLDIVNFYQGGSDQYASGSEVVVLGYDPDDTHTDNFWEQLADVTLSSTGDNLSSGTISAKKYLWIQTYISDTGGQDSVNMTFNNDTGNNYAFRRNNNGGTDATTTSTSHITLHSSEVTEDLFSNVFIINNSSNEKFVIGHTIQNQTLGAGTAPIRKEFVGKWANTSSQITEIDLDNNSTGSYDTNSFIKVWGSN